MASSTSHQMGASDVVVVLVAAVIAVTVSASEWGLLKNATELATREKKSPRS